MFHIPFHKSGTAGQIVNPVPARTLADYVADVVAGEYGPAATRMVVDALFGESWVQVVPTDGRPAEFTSYDEARDFAMQLRCVSGLAFKIRFVP